MSNEIELYAKINDPISAAAQLGEWFAKSGMFGCERIEQGQVMALTCLAEKKTPIEVNRKYHLIGGKLSMRSDYMLADFRQRGGKCLWLETGENGKEARANFQYDGNAMEISFTIDEATRAGLVKPNSGWTKFPGAMLRARLITKAMRMIAPEVVAGLVSTEEAADIQLQTAPTAPITSDAIPARIKVVKVEDAEIVTPAASEETPPQDDGVSKNSGVMPVGNHRGKPWEKFTDKQLEAILKKSSEMKEFTAAHKVAIQGEMDKRRAAAEQEAK